MRVDAKSSFFADGCLYTCLQTMFWNQQIFKQLPAKHPLIIFYKLYFLDLIYLTFDSTAGKYLLSSSSLIHNIVYI